MSQLELEIEKNFRAFRAIEPTLLAKASGKYALLRGEALIGVYDTIRDAQVTGKKFYEDGLFSVQRVGAKPSNLGFYSYAVRMAPAQ